MEVMRDESSAEIVIYVPWSEDKDNSFDEDNSVLVLSST